MALTKNMDFFGFNTDVYVKIGGFLVKETGKDEEGKLYSADAQMDYFTNSTKSHHFSQEVKKVEKLRDEELNLASIYEKVSALPEYEGFTNA